MLLSSCAVTDDTVSEVPKQRKKATNKRSDLDHLLFTTTELSLPEAITKYADTDKQSSVDSKILANAASHANDLSDNAAAETLANEAVRLDDTNGNAYYQRGRARCNAIVGKDKEAMEDLQKAISLGRADANVHHYQARIYDANKQPLKAIESLTLAIKLDPSSKTLYRSRAALYVSVGERGKALRDYEVLCKLDPTSLEYQFQKGQVLETMKKFEEATAEYKKVIAMDETGVKLPLRSITFKRLAFLNGEKGKHNEAIANLTESAKIDIDDDEPLRLRGLEYSKLGKYQEALKDLTAAIETSPDTSANFLARAEVYSKLGKQELAEKDKREAARLHDVPAERPMFELKNP